MKKAILGSLYFIPVLAFAQSLTGLVTLVTEMQNVLNNLYPFLFGLAIIYFFWGVAKYILAAGDPKAAAEGRSIMIWGIVALAVMASIYGLIFFLQNAFGVNANNTTPILPSLP
jgi:hypothetical protein